MACRGSAVKVRLAPSVFWLGITKIMSELTNIFKKYFLINLRFLYEIYNYANIFFNGKLFCFIFNIKSKFLNKDVSFNLDKSNLMYATNSKKYIRYFFAKKQNILSYSRGIDQRGMNLGKIYMLDKINFKPGDIVIDCGANIGDLEIFFNEIKIDINYIAYEPSPLEFYCLKKNLLLKKSRCFNYALFDKEDILKFYISSEYADSSLIKIKKFTHEKNVQAKRLDSIIDELKLEKIKLLKLEAEGAEPEVLLGCGDKLQNIQYISADLGFERGIQQESTLPNVSNILIEKGFEMISIISPRLVCLFKNKNFIS